MVRLANAGRVIVICESPPAQLPDAATPIAPVVGLPLPLVSYGGTSLVTMMAAFGILMSIHTHRRLLSS